VKRTRFVDREDAGTQLAAALADREWPNAVVLGLPRGGIPVAAEIAHRLELPLDVLVVRKLGYPGQPELAVGAIGEKDVHVLNDELLAKYPVPGGALASVERAERRELERRVATYRRNRLPLDLANKTVIVCDDGMATGSTMLAAVEVVRCMDAAEIVVAVPVASAQAVLLLSRRAHRVVALHAPISLGAVGRFYDDFTQVQDNDVTTVLAQFVS